jgi:hypothetical protein
MQTLKAFVKRSQQSVAYKVTEKNDFHSKGRAVLRQIADALGLAKGTYDIRSNTGGIAVSGEVTLHGENIYVQFSQSSLGISTLDILFRTVKGRKDYTGGRNNFMKFTDLLDFDTAVARIRQVMDGVTFPIF